MAVLDEILAANAQVAGKLEPSGHDFTASRRLCLVTCIDPRLTRFFSQALGIDRGDATIVRIPGPALGTGGDLLRSVATAIFVNDCAEVLVLAHTDCGLTRCDSGALSSAMNRRGVDRGLLPADPRSYFALAASPRQIAIDTAGALRAAPFIPSDVLIHAGVIDIDTGKVEIVERGENVKAVPRSGAQSPFASSPGLPTLSGKSTGLPSLSAPGYVLPTLSGPSSDLGGLPAGLGVGAAATGASKQLFSDLPAGLGIGAAASGSLSSSIPAASLSPVGFELPKTTLQTSTIDLSPSIRLSQATQLQPVETPLPTTPLSSIAPDLRPQPRPAQPQPQRPPPRKPQPQQQAVRPQQSPRLNISTQLKSQLEKVNAFYRSEMRPETRQAALVELDESYQQGSANAELIRVVFKPILESGPKRYKVIDELLAIKESAAGMQRSECYAALRQMLA